MSRYIDRDKLKARLNASPAFQNMGQDGIFLKEVVLNIIDGQPTADAVEVRHGHWVKQKPDTEAMKIIHDMGLGKGMSVNSIYWTCSICENWGTPTHKYCCSCGAKMDGERKDNGR